MGLSCERLYYVYDKPNEIHTERKKMLCICKAYIAVCESQLTRKYSKLTLPQDHSKGSVFIPWTDKATSTLLKSQ